MEKIFSSQATNWREGRSARLETAPEGLETTSYLRGIRSNPRGSQPVAEASQGRGRGRLTPPSPSWGSTPSLSGTASPIASAIIPGSRSLGFTGRCVHPAQNRHLDPRPVQSLYDPSQVGRILKASGWSWQKPVHRASQRDEKVIRQWREERWPQIKKGHRGEADSGFCRPVRFLSIAWPGKNLCSSRADLADSGSPEPRPPFCHGWYYS